MELKANVQIGKSGITPEIIEELKMQLKKRKIVKIKFLKNADRENFKEKAEFIAKSANAELVEIRGFTIVLRKR